MARILIIEDEDNLRFTIRRTLSKAGYELTEAANVRDARAAFTSNDFDLILTDIMLGGTETGLDLVRELRSADSTFDGVIVVMTAFTSIENAVAAMRDGADDYIQKPLSLEELGLQVAKWIEHRHLKQRVNLYERLEQSREQSNEIVGESPAWRQTLSVAERLAKIPLPEQSSASAQPGALNGSAQGASGGLPCILIVGETGVGKGVLARFIHAKACVGSGKASGEAAAPFVHVNCSALPATLVEGELFGHEKGAFTDARDARAGLFEMADGGTIFLDEVSETPLEFQAKLLTVVEHGVFRRVGGTKEKRVRVRVIAASNQNLEERVTAGRFRRDLLYRLNAFTIKIPPLRERNGDSVRIAESMIERLSRRYGRGERGLSDAAREAIAGHPWLGNVRELVNAVQRAVMLGDGPSIEPEDLGLEAAPPMIGEAVVPGAIAPGGINRMSLENVQECTLVFDFENGVHKASEVEKELIMQALRHTRGNVSRAAKLIGMQRSSLRYRIDRYHLENYVVEVASR